MSKRLWNKIKNIATDEHGGTRSGWQPRPTVPFVCVLSVFVRGLKQIGGTYE
jgi:hypothetical protein